MHIGAAKIRRKILTGIAQRKKDGSKVVSFLSVGIGCGVAAVGCLLLFYYSVYQIFMDSNPQMRILTIRIRS
jgi:hypothetical protein